MDGANFIFLCLYMTLKIYQQDKHTSNVTVRIVLLLP